MKFFHFIPLSNCPKGSSVSRCGVPNIPVPFHRLYFQYSILQTQPPRNVFPNIVSLLQEIPVAISLMFFLLASSLSRLCSKKVNILYACAHDPYLQLLLGSLHFPHYLFAPKDPCIELANPLSIHGNDTLLPKLYGHLTYLLYENSFDNLPYSKSKKFLETKVAAMELRGFNHS